MGGTEAKVLLIGLDASGKTTILQKLYNPHSTQINTTPTIGFKKQKISREGIDIQVIDMSGQAKYRDLWKTNATNSSPKDKISGIIFVVDSTNKMRLNVARSQLDIILQNQQIPNYLPYLFYSNKTDLKDSIPVEQVEEILQLKKINRNYRICPCSGISGQGVQAGMTWFIQQIKKIIQVYG